MEEDHATKKPIGSDPPSVLLLLSTLLFVLLIIDYGTRSIDFQSSWVTVAAFALTFFYMVLVTGESEPTRMREFLKAYAIVLLLIVAFILAYEIYKTNSQSPLGSIVGRIVWKVGSILLIIQSIAVVVLTAWAKGRAPGDEKRTAKRRLVLSIMMLFFSPANYLLYVLLFFEGT